MRPPWSSGTLVASPTPVSWQSRQAVRPSRVWDIGVGVAVVAAGTTSFAGVVGDGVGVSGWAGAAPPPQAASNVATRSIATITHKTGFLFTTLHLLLTLNRL